MLGPAVGRWQELLESDGEFRRAARSWSGSFAFADGESHTVAYLTDGAIVGVASGGGPAQADIVFVGPREGWAKVFAAEPPPYFQDLVGGACGRHGFTVSGDLLSMSAHYPAIQRAAVLAGKALRGEVARARV